MSSRPSPRWLRRPRRAGAWLVSVAAGNAEGAVYGTVMVGVLLAAEDTRHEGFPQTVGAGAIILALYWLAHFYTHTLAIRLTKREELNATLFWQSCVHELPVIEGAIIPVLVLLVAWAAGATITAGVTAALWTAAVTIVALEIAAGWRARLEPRRLWLQAGAGVLMGSAVIALKLELH